MRTVLKETSKTDYVENEATLHSQNHGWELLHPNTQFAPSTDVGHCRGQSLRSFYYHGPIKFTKCCHKWCGPWYLTSHDWVRLHVALRKHRCLERRAEQSWPDKVLDLGKIAIDHFLPWVLKNDRSHKDIWLEWRMRWLMGSFFRSSFSCSFTIGFSQIKYKHCFSDLSNLFFHYLSLPSS